MRCDFRDFVIGQHSAAELRGAHHRLVDILRARRPAGGWKISRDDPVAVYVCKEIAGHIKEGWDLARYADDRASVVWLDDFPTQQDVVPLAATHVLGITRASALAEEAERVGDWWHAALRWAALANEVKFSVVTESGDQYSKFLKAAGSALHRVRPDIDCSALDKQRLEVKVIIDILQRWDPADQAVYGPQLEPLLQSEAAREMPTLAMKAIIILKVYPAVLGGDFDAVIASYFEVWMTMKPMIVQAESEDEQTMAFMTMFSLYSLFLEALIRHKSFTWDGVFGPGGNRITKAVQNYNADTMHDTILSLATTDGMGTGPCSIFPILFHWGDLATANANTDIVLSNMRSLKTSAAYVKLTPRTAVNSTFQWLMPWPIMLHCLGRNEDALEFMQEAQIVASKADETWQQLVPLCSMVIKARGDTRESFGLAEESVSLLSKIVYSLVSGDKCGIDALATVNYSPDEFTALGQSTQSNMSTLHGWGCPVWVALAFERFGQSERALAFAAKSLETDMQAGGNPHRWLQSFALSCRGRVMAALGDMAKAEAAFEDALTIVDGHEYWFIEACTLHDLVEKVLRQAGCDTSKAEARLAAIINKIKSSREELSAYLKGRFEGWTGKFEALAI
eukprot:SAG31_NODE_3127_length_4646_cov_6.057620_1_plen_623_part_00